MTNRAAALLAYFHTIASDRKVQAAGRDPRAFIFAVFDCAVEDFPAAGSVVLGLAQDYIVGKVDGAAAEWAAGVGAGAKDFMQEIFGLAREALSGAGRRQKR